MPWLIPIRRTAFAKNARGFLFSKFRVVSESAYFLLQERKKLFTDSITRRTRQAANHNYRIVTKDTMPYYEVGYSNSLEEIKKNEWEYCKENLPQLIPQELKTQQAAKARQKWLIAHFTQKALESGGEEAVAEDDADGETALSDHDDDEEDDKISTSLTQNPNAFLSPTNTSANFSASSSPAASTTTLATDAGNKSESDGEEGRPPHVKPVKKPMRHPSAINESFHSPPPTHPHVHHRHYAPSAAPLPVALGGAGSGSGAGGGVGVGVGAALSDQTPQPVPLRQRSSSEADRRLFAALASVRDAAKPTGPAGVEKEKLIRSVTEKPVAAHSHANSSSLTTSPPPSTSTLQSASLPPPSSSSTMSSSASSFSATSSSPVSSALFASARPVDVSLRKDSGADESDHKPSKTTPTAASAADDAKNRSRNEGENAAKKVKGNSSRPITPSSASNAASAISAAQSTSAQQKRAVSPLPPTARQLPLPSAPPATLTSAQLAGVAHYPIPHSLGTSLSSPPSSLTSYSSAPAAAASAASAASVLRAITSASSSSIASSPSTSSFLSSSLSGGSPALLSAPPISSPYLAQCASTPFPSSSQPAGGAVSLSVLLHHHFIARSALFPLAGVPSFILLLFLFMAFTFLVRDASMHALVVMHLFAAILAYVLLVVKPLHMYVMIEWEGDKRLAKRKERELIQGLTTPRP